MPIVRVEMWNCRDTEQKKKMAQELTKVMVDNIHCPPQAVQVLFTEVPQDNWAIGGSLCSDIYKDLK